MKKRTGRTKKTERRAEELIAKFTKGEGKAGVVGLG